LVRSGHQHICRCRGLLVGCRILLLLDMIMYKTCLHRFQNTCSRHGNSAFWVSNFRLDIDKLVLGKLFHIDTCCDAHKYHRLCSLECKWLKIEICVDHVLNNYNSQFLTLASGGCGKFPVSGHPFAIFTFHIESADRWI
jgi:hypothetical protein